MALCWAVTANDNTKFRLVGPWKWKGAEAVMEGEIWETVSRRRGFFGEASSGIVGVSHRMISMEILIGHLTLSVTPIGLFGTLSAILYAVEGLYMLLKFL